MVNRQSTISHTHLHTSGNRQLVGMDFRLQPMGGTCLQYPCSLVHCEESFITENIHEFSQPFSCHGRNHFPAYKVHISFLVSPPGPPYGVGPEKSRPDLNRNSFADSAYNPEHLQFIFCRESVSALYFHGSGTFGHDFFNPDHGLTEKFVFRCGMKQVGRVKDSASACSNFLIAQPLNLVPELPVAAAGIDDVGMGIAECRHDIASSGIDSSVKQ